VTQGDVVNLSDSLTAPEDCQLASLIQAILDPQFSI